MEEATKKVKIVNKYGGGDGMVYCLGFIGALIYYLQRAVTLQDGLIGVFKALTWPAFLVYKLLEILKF